MRRGLFGKLAVQNIRNNRSTYIPYMLTCIFCIAMMYMMEFLRDCPTLEKAVPQASEVRLIVGTGEVVVGIFCVIFLIYSNSFLMKRRQKEIGLYNILGLEKGHIGKVMFLETIMTSLLSLAAGIGFGILGSKLSLLLLFRFLHVPAVLGFYVSITGILFCIAGFGGIFLVILALNLTRVRMNNPVELLKGGNTGEREPRAKWLMAFLGVICLGVGYYLAVTTESPIQAIFIFLLAVILVMAGTYLLFTAGSIVILKLLRKNKKFYYKTSNFISVSGMIYRMKQNAAGLASICILSTGVLLLLSMTVSLYFGMGDIMVNRYPFDTDAQISGISQEQSEQFQKVFAQAIEDYQVPAEKTVTETYLEIGCKQGKNGIMIGQAYSYSEDGNSVDLYTIRQSEYEKLTGEKTDLHDGEIFAWYPSERETDTLKIDDWDFAVKKWLEKAPLSAMTNLVSNMAAIVVTDSDFEYIDGLRTKMYEGLDAYEAGKDLTVHLGVDIRGSSEEKIRYGHAVYQALKDYCHSDGFSENTIVIGGVRQSEYETYYVDNGSILFIGIFLGALFLMGTAMIIYYKQISEGYEDQGRFQIMQKVGMSRREVKGAIRRQILLVFFIPLVMAMVHISMAFPLIRRLLLLFGMANTKLYVGCTAGTVLAFALVYGLIYSMTARSYYKIVEKA